MTKDNQHPAKVRRRSSLWAYNVRILAGNTYWLVAIPVAATQLVLFWNMATATLFSPTRAAQTIELLSPILGAFMCAYALAPEQDGVGELVFVRPVSFEKILLLRLAVILAFVFAVISPAFVIYRAGIHDFPLGMTVLAAVPSMLFLSILAMALASATRHPLIGFGAAGAFWVLDLSIGSHFNPLVSLHGFSDHLANRPMAEQWVVGKLILVGLAVLLYVWNRRLLGRPPAPRRWVSAARSAVLLILLLSGYIAAGAGYKVAYGIRHERDLGYRARLWYQQQFRCYGPLPVAWMLGPAFPLYVQAEVGRDIPLAGPGTAGSWTAVDLSRMRALLERYPNSIWADNAQFEMARYWRGQPAALPWLVISCRAGERAPTQRWMREDAARASQEFQKLVDRYPDSPFAPLALSQRAFIGLNMLDFDLPRTSYERLVADYPRAPEAYDAGMRLAAAYRREGEFQKALAAADTAAEVAAWDIQAEALLAAARAAQHLGREDLSRDRYRRARAAALRAVERATRGHKSPSRLLKGELFDRSNAVIQACEHAMSGNAASPPPKPAATEVVGRIVKDGRGLPGVRVALGASAAGDGLPSPFHQGPAVSATTDDEGAFQLSPVLAGQYRVAAFAVQAPQEELECFVENLRLPVSVNGSPILLPTFHLQCRQRQNVEPVARRASPTSLRRAPRDGELRRSRSETTHRGGRGRR
ncbi:MAG: hypothetical protein JSV79_09550 [Armatimonadota bacterium]|nr:MAG: hypothetical protein JSV79_09550 [Armatimonadota bacterium]